TEGFIRIVRELDAITTRLAIPGRGGGGRGHRVHVVVPNDRVRHDRLGQLPVQAQARRVYAHGDNGGNCRGAGRGKAGGGSHPRGNGHLRGGKPPQGIHGAKGRQVR